MVEERISVAVVETPQQFSDTAEEDERHPRNMSDDPPIKQRYYPKNPYIKEKINGKVDELLQKGCIEPSRSSYSSPIVMVKKKRARRGCVWISDK